MEEVVNTELNYFLWSFLLGLSLAFLYDLLRAFRKIKTHSVWGLNLQDGIFFLVAGGVLFWTAYIKNGGQLRWQGQMGTIGAIGIYYMIVKNRVRNILTICYGGLIRLWITLVKIVLLPVGLVYRLLRRPILVIGWYSKKTVHRAGSLLRIQKVRRKIYRRCSVRNRRGRREKTVDK